MKLLIDTNILLDLVLDRQPYSNDIRKLCIGVYFGDLQIWINIQSYTDAYYVLRKHYSESEAKQMLLGTLAFFTPLACSPEDLKAALTSDWADIEDYLIVRSGKHAQVKFFITRDSAAMQSSSITAYTAKEMLAYIKEHEGLVYQDIDI